MFFTGDILGIVIGICDTDAPKSERFVPIVPGPVAAAYRLPALPGT